MDIAYWQKQTITTPLYPDLLWSRPENKTFAGKLLIIGGSIHGFAAPAESYAVAERTGIGSARVILPDAMQKSVGRIFVSGVYAPSTKIGSFSQQALQTFLTEAAWADCIIVAGDTGRNSETTIVLDHFLETFRGPVVITKDAADFFCEHPLSVLQRPDSLFVLSAGQLKKLGVQSHFSRPFSSSLDLLRLIDNLHEFTKRFELSLLCRSHEQYIVAHHGLVTTTPIHQTAPTWRLETATKAAVWWAQNPTKLAESVSTSLIAAY